MIFIFINHGTILDSFIRMLNLAFIWNIFLFYLLKWQNLLQIDLLQTSYSCKRLDFFKLKEINWRKW